MSQKQASIEISARDEVTDDEVGVALCVDYINPGYVYLTVIGGSPIVIPNADAQKIAAFLFREAR